MLLGGAVMEMLAVVGSRDVVDAGEGGHTKRAFWRQVITSGGRLEEDACCEGVEEGFEAPLERSGILRGPGGCDVRIR